MAGITMCFGKPGKALIPIPPQNSQRGSSHASPSLCHNHRFVSIARQLNPSYQLGQRFNQMQFHCTFNHTTTPAKPYHRSPTAVTPKPAYPCEGSISKNQRAVNNYPHLQQSLADLTFCLLWDSGSRFHNKSIISRKSEEFLTRGWSLIPQNGPCDRFPLMLFSKVHIAL